MTLRRDCRFVIQLALALVGSSTAFSRTDPAAPVKPIAEISLDRPAAARMASPDWLSFSSDAKYIAARYDAGKTDLLHVWTVRDWKTVASWPVLTHQLPRRTEAGTCAFDRHTNSIYSFEADCGLRKYSLGDKKTTEVLNLKSSSKSFFPEGLILPVRKDDAFVMYGSSTIKPTFLRLECPSDLGEGKPKEVAIAHSLETVSSLTCSRTSIILSGRLASDTTQFAVWKWDVKDGKANGQQIYQSDVGVTALAVSLDGRHVALGTTAGEVRILNEAGKSLYSKVLFKFSVTCCQFSGDGDMLLVGSADRFPQVNLRLVKWQDNQIPISVNAGPKGVLRSCIAPDKNQIAAIGSDSLLRVWNVPAKEK